MNNPIPVILDTDIGTDIDDMWALAMLLGCPELDPKLILTCCGDTQYRANLTAKFLQVADRTDIPIGIGLCEESNAESNLNFQEEWLSDFHLEGYQGKQINSGVEALIDLIKHSTEMVTIISIGATTNIAQALKYDPSLAEKCRFVGMQGSIHRGYDEDSGPVPEANVRTDVPAFRKVLSANWQEIIITPLDTCGKVVLTGHRYQRLLASRQPQKKALLENYYIFLKIVPWYEVDFFHERSTTLFDPVAVYLAYGQAFLEIETIKISVNDHGLTYLDPNGFEVKAALQWKDLPGFYDHLLDRLLNTSV